MQKTIIISGCICAFSMFLPFFVFSQETPVAQDTLTEKEITPIPVSEIIIQSASLQVQLNEEFEQIITEDEINKLHQQVDTLSKKVQHELQEPALENIPSLSLRELKREEMLIASLDDQVSQFQETLIDEIHNFDEKITNIRALENLWQLSYENAEANKGSPLIISRAQATLNKLDSLNQLLSAKENVIIQMLDAITNQHVQVTQRLDAVNEQLTGGGDNLYSRKYSPLYKISEIGETDITLANAWQDFFDANRGYFKEYLSDNSYRFYFHIMLALVLYALLVFLGRHHQPPPPPLPYYQKVTEVLLGYPFVSTLLFILYIVPVVYPKAPVIFSNSLSLFLIIPFLILTVRILPARLHLGIYGLALAFACDRIYSVFPTESLLGRGLIFISAILLLAVNIYAIKTIYRQQWIHRKGVRNLILFFLAIFALISFGGIIANVEGYIFVAELWVISTRQSLYGGILTVIVACLVIGLVNIFLNKVLAKKIQSVQRNTDAIRKAFIPFILILFLYLWFDFVLGKYQLQSEFYGWIASIWSFAIELGSVNITAGNIMLFFFTLWLSTVIARVICALLEDDVLPQFKLDRGVPYTVTLLVRYTIITLGFFLAIATAGIPLTSLTVILGAFSVGIGFGLQNIFNNLVSGLILAFERPLKIGDTIEVGTLVGNVRSIGVRSSNIRSFDGADVIVPNGSLIANDVVNWTHSDRQRRIEVIAGVSYDADPNTVYDLLMNILQQHEDVIKFPEPVVFFHNMGESSLDFRMLFWTDNSGEWVRIRSEVIFQVFYKLKEAGIEIPYPQRDLHLKSGGWGNGESNLPGSVKPKIKESSQNNPGQDN